jgi:hypothetical protein
MINTQQLSQNTANNSNNKKPIREWPLALRIENLILNTVIHPMCLPVVKNSCGTHVSRIVLLEMIGHQIETISSGLLNKIIADMELVGTIGISAHDPHSVYSTKNANATLMDCGFPYGGSL